MVGGAGGAAGWSLSANKHVHNAAVFRAGTATARAMGWSPAGSTSLLFGAGNSATALIRAMGWQTVASTAQPSSMATLLAPRANALAAASIRPVATTSATVHAPAAGGVQRAQSRKSLEDSSDFLKKKGMRNSPRPLSASVLPLTTISTK